METVTEALYLRDAYLREFTAEVTDVADGAVALDRTAFYPTGGGQPHDTGPLEAGGWSPACYQPGRFVIPPTQWRVRIGPSEFLGPAASRRQQS
ncbi:MAG: misacylated tRNA(Ala) deacylase [Acidimicrobiaceae bacterium]|nr:misacylated tRNA(Ala) deacylase [Acidimicrobiaceae bacterium]